MGEKGLEICISNCTSGILRVRGVWEAMLRDRWQLLGSHQALPLGCELQGPAAAPAFSVFPQNLAPRRHVAQAQCLFNE